MDFDELKRVWNTCDNKLDAALDVKASRIRSLLAGISNTDSEKPSRHIDFTAPVVHVYQQLNASWVVNLTHRAGAWIQKICGAEELTGRLQTSLERALRRHRRTLRS